MYNENHNQKNKITRYVKKMMAIKYLGGKCMKCGDDNFFKLTFHHRNTHEKEFHYNEKADRRWSIIKKELEKCDILCQNCHREEHYILDNNDKRRKSKEIYLEYSKQECERCGYKKCPAALSFHHKNAKDKHFMIGTLSERISTIEDLSVVIKNELDKCEVLCSNCHVLEHSDIIFFEKNRNIIEKRCSEYKETQPKIDRDIVCELYNSGFRQIEISIKLKASKGTISDIIKNLKKEGRI